MTIENVERRLAHLEDQVQDASARLLVTEALLSSIMRFMPEALEVLDHFELHQDCLEAMALNNSGVSDAWVSKLQAARKITVYRLRHPSEPDSTL